MNIYNRPAVEVRDDMVLFIIEEYEIELLSLGLTLDSLLEMDYYEVNVIRVKCLNVKMEK